MVISSLSDYRRRRWRRRLAAAVTVGLLAGVYTPTSWAAEYNAQITGGADSAYTDVIQSDGSYKFEEDTTIKYDGPGVIYNSTTDQKDVIIDAGDNTLNVVATRSGFLDYLYGAYIYNHDAQIIASEINLKSTESGIWGVASGAQARSGSLILNGNTNVNASAADQAWGLEAYSGGSLIVNGNVTMKGEGDTQWGVMTTDTTGSTASAALYAHYNGSNITVNGDVDIAARDTAVYATDTSRVTINGGGNITVSDNESYGTYALYATQGTIGMNKGLGDNDITINGNVGVAQLGTVILGLSTADSELNGAVVGGVENGEVDLTLLNGATWTNESWGTNSDFSGSSISNFVGGSDIETDAGYILQKDSNDLTINNYSGATVIFYAHANDGDDVTDYAAGDTHIKSAAEGSVVRLGTDTEGMENVDAIADDVLSALAQKLYYEAAGTDTNLTGEVGIASGLTSSSQWLALGDMGFDAEKEGQGYYAKEPQTYNFSNAITGSLSADKVYVDAGVVTEDAPGVYNFGDNAEVNINMSGAAGIEAQQGVSDLVINADGGVLNVTNAGNTYNSVNAVKQGITGNLTVNAGQFNVTATNSDTTGSVRAIELSTNNSNRTPVAEINAQLNVTAQSNGGTAYGIYANGDSTLTVNGDVVMNSGEEGEWAVSGSVDEYALTSSSAAIYTSQANNPTTSGEVNINGNVDLAVDANGLLATGADGVINVNGGGSIVTNAATDGLYAIAATRNGVVNMNVVTEDGATSAGTEDVTINGNIGVISTFYGSMSSAWGGTSAEVNLGLGTKDSELHGVIYNSYSDSSANANNANLYLQNGATWTNESWGTIVNDMDAQAFSGSRVTNFVGGSDIDNAGYILQKDSNDLTINNYSGAAVIMYEHTNDGDEVADYAAGDTHIKKASEGSVVRLGTDTEGMSNVEAIADDVLSALAQKLYYEAAGTDTNLKGEVGIASGLTSSATWQVVGDMGFDAEKGGQGYYDNEPGGQTEFSATITGVDANDTAYKDAGVLQDDGRYVFGQDSTITTTGAPAISAQDEVIIDASGSKLSAVVTTSSGNIYGVQNTGNNKVEITADELNLSVTGTARTDGINMSSYSDSVKPEVIINGDLVADVSSTGRNGAYGVFINGNGALTVNGDVKLTVDGNNGGWSYYGSAAIDSYGSSYNKVASTVDINGNVDISGKTGGLLAYAAGSVINVNGGGKIVVDEDNTGGYAAIRAENGVVNMNVKQENGETVGAGNDVNITGNIAVTTGTVSSGDPNGTLSQVNLALDTKDSTLDGVIYNTFADEGITAGSYTFTGETNLWLQNGATWTNEQHGDVVDDGRNAMEYTGSRVTNFVGGSDIETDAGYILQKDSNDLTIDNYSGTTVIFYEHANDGDEVTDYAAGDTHIKSAAEGSVVRLGTDTEGMENVEAIADDVLSALAQKLYYEAAVDGDTNLKGEVGIASGLTSSSQWLALGDMGFDAEKEGQGYYDKADEPQGPITSTKQIVEDNWLAGDNIAYWQEQGVRADREADYTFSDDATLNIKVGDADNVYQFQDDHVSAIWWNGDAEGTIDMQGNALTLNVDGSNDSGFRTSGIRVSSGDLTINNPGGLNINMNNGGNGAHGIYVYGYRTMGATDYGAGNSSLTINNGYDEENAVKIRYNGGANNQESIYADANTGTAKVVINGLVDIVNSASDAVSGVANVENTTVHTSDIYIGGGKIIADGPGAYSLRSLGATIAVNATLNEDGTITADADDRDVVIEGNVLVSNYTTKWYDTISQGDIAIALNTADSSLTGNIEQTIDGRAHVILANGAVWNNVDQGSVASSVYELQGGSGIDSAGWIYQTNPGTITIDNYSGATVIFYEHADDGDDVADYAAGDTHIKSAAEGSVVRLGTDTTGMTDVDAIADDVLSVLAQKLYYEAAVDGDTNLKGEVGIASGLTSSSQWLALGDMGFDADNDGQGYYDKGDEPDEPVVNDYTVPITGDRDTDTLYVDGGVLQDDGQYVFTADASIKVDGEAAAINLNNKDNVIVDSGDNTLTIEAQNGSGNYHRAIYTNNSSLTITGEELNVTAKSDSKRTDAISINSSVGYDSKVVFDTNVNIDAEGSSANGVYALASNVTFNKDLNITLDGNNGGWGYYGASGLYATGMMGNQGQGTNIDVNGKYTYNGRGNGVFANTGGTQVNLNGDVDITVTDDGNKTYAAINAQDATVNVNVDENGATGNTVKIVGNVVADTGAVNAMDKLGTETVINLGLTNKDSSLQGVVYNMFPDEGKTAGDLVYTGEINMYLQNGASWTNELVGSIGSGFSGSHVSTFTGGSDIDSAGYIYQNDSNDLTIDNYSGATVIFYEHANDGDDVADYAAGDTHIKNAAEGSYVRLGTDTEGMTDVDSVAEAVLGALAQKLYYEAAVDGDTNLTGEVGIASGLTSSATWLALGDMGFDAEKDGQGYYDKGDEPDEPDKPVEPDEPDEPVTPPTDYSDRVLRADVTAESKWLAEGDSVIKDADGKVVYEFTNDSEFDYMDLDGGNTVEVNAAGKTLTFNEGITMTDGDNVVINADLDIKNNSDADWGVNGIAMGIGGTGTGAETHLTINGDVTMRNDDADNPWAITGGPLHGGYDYYEGARWDPTGIKAGNTAGSSITINGDVDLAVKGTAVSTDPYYSKSGMDSYDLVTLNLNGGNVNIDTPVDDSNPYYSLANYGGTLNVNATEDGAVSEDHVVTMTGNIITMKNDGSWQNTNYGNFFFQDGQTNIGLVNDQSVWNGVVDNTGKNQTGEVNLWLQNGAQWNHENMSQTNGMSVETMPGPSNEVYGVYDGVSYINKLTGGDSADNAGYIYQNDTAEISINEYSGYTTIFYAHDNDGDDVADYTAGDTHIKSAAEGSVVRLGTDTAGITDVDSVAEAVLGALAQKLYYEAAGTDTNLKGEVGIASGLTSSSQWLALGNMGFDAENGGQGYYDKGDTPDVPDTPTEYSGQLTGGADAAYDEVRQDDGSYKFTSDTTIKYDGETPVKADSDIVIDASGNNFSVEATNSDEWANDVKGVYTYGKDVSVTADTINVSAEKTSGFYGTASGVLANGGSITLTGDTNVTAKSVDNAYGVEANKGAITVDGNLAVSGLEASDAWGQYYDTIGLYAHGEGGNITVNGDVDLDVNDTAVYASGNSSVTINGGGTITTAATDDHETYALYAEQGSIGMNEDLGENDITINGNVGVAQLGSVTLGLSTADSELNGAVVGGVENGEVDLTLVNGASWNNALYGSNEDFNGSHVSALAGGDSRENAGNIYQNDSNALTIDNYSGYTNIFYAHANDGDDVADYAAGDTHIKNAAEGSVVRLGTDTEGMTDVDSVAEAVLGALAQKLYYEAAVDGDANLKGEVGIASGLTSSSQWQVVGDMGFDAENGGQGYYEEGSLKPVEPDTPGGDISKGDYESYMMQGVRSAMMTSMLAWRDNAADIYGRAEDIRDGEDEGVWAKVHSGKNRYEGAGTNFNNSYWAGQVGYDRKLGNDWIVGAMIDYRDGDADYLLGGKGDNKLYSFGIYGSKQLGGSEYLDLAVKVGKVENDYSVYNETHRELNGSYDARAYSFSAQYGKRFGDKKGYWEPQLQLTYAHVESADDTAYAGSDYLNINQDAFDSLVGRVGVKAGRDTGRTNLYAILSLNYEFAGDVDGTYYAKDGGLKSTSFDVGGAWSDLTVGASHRFSKDADVYAEFTRSLSGDYQHQWKANLGLRFTF